MSLITFGLSQILVGAASPDGIMPGSLIKIGQVYRDTCKIAQEASEVTEFFEEGKSAPELRRKTKKMPTLTFSIMSPDIQLLIDYVGGTDIGSAGASKWGFDGTELNVNKSIRVQTEQGLVVDIPNGDIEAVINGEFSAKGLFMVDFTVKPLSVTAGKAISAYNGSAGLTVAPTTLSFTAAADTVGKTITATSTGNVTYAAAPSGQEWLTVTKSSKVVTVKVLANTNSEARTANVTIVADGLTAIVPVTQAGA